MNKRATYTPTIGLEVHAELNTVTKMFCNSKNAPHASEPNTHICPVCLGHPGTLPTINKRAVQSVLIVGLALNAKLADYTEFDRKNYFYPDIPKGYQISQYQHPLVSGGELAGVAITRVHLEEDTARSLHEQGDGSLIDFNRAGVPLMELVTEPVIHDAHTAGMFARELQLLLRTLGVSHANMEKGEMRVEANISISDTDNLGTKVEVKNLNSFKSVEAAIVYEMQRQEDLITRGESVVQETRGWDENRGKTFSQRKKESSHDYRYFPDPDLEKMMISKIPEFSRTSLSEKIPELPNKKREKYTNLGLSSKQIEVIISDTELDSFFNDVISEIDKSIVPIAANYLVTDVLGYRDGEIKNASAGNFGALMTMVSKNVINSRVAKDMLPEVVFGGEDPNALAKKRGLIQQSSKEILLPIVDEIIKTHQKVVDEYRTGKDSALQFLIGQGMKMTKGSANPTVLKEILIERIS